jgi:hypothetical protein
MLTQPSTEHAAADPDGLLILQARYHLVERDIFRDYPEFCAVW